MENGAFAPKGENAPFSIIFSNLWYFKDIKSCYYGGMGLVKAHWDSKKAQINIVLTCTFIFSIFSES